eukprot:2081561-Rhodomonas_salina.2
MGAKFGGRDLGDIGGAADDEEERLNHEPEDQPNQAWSSTHFVNKCQDRYPPKCHVRTYLPRNAGHTCPEIDAFACGFDREGRCVCLYSPRTRQIEASCAGSVPNIAFVG